MGQAQAWSPLPEASPCPAVAITAKNLSGLWPFKGLPLLQVFQHMTAGSVLGAAVALACQYLAYGANGGSYADSAAKARKPTCRAGTGTLCMLRAGHADCHKLSRRSERLA